MDNTCGTQLGANFYCSISKGEVIAHIHFELHNGIDNAPHTCTDRYRKYKRNDEILTNDNAVCK